ncbi:MAG: DUF2087 domain-containing protein [Firmicutes bacterium]|nr:DUF2087 domain-containing protein [Bacillota bacterium]
MERTNIEKILMDRFEIKEEDIIDSIRFFGKDGRLFCFPSKQKNKVIIFIILSNKFEFDIEYSEKEINMELKRIVDDFPLFRRALIDFGLFSRTRDCKVYTRNR